MNKVIKMVSKVEKFHEVVISSEVLKETNKEKELAGQVFGIRSIPSILFIPVNGQPTLYTGAYPKEHYVDLIKENLLKK